jgi:hypothetical protein
VQSRRYQVLSIDIPVPWCHNRQWPKKMSRPCPVSFVSQALFRDRGSLVESPFAANDIRILCECQRSYKRQTVIKGARATGKSKRRVAKEHTFQSSATRSPSQRKLKLRE